MLYADLHSHLFGCLTPKDIWFLGRDRVKSRSSLMDWYAQEYQKAWGRQIDWRSYWRRSDGIERLAQDYELLEPASFQQFQACFNLVIAAIGIDPSATDVLERVLRSYNDQGVNYVELRTMFPARFIKHDCLDYLTSQAEAILPFESSSFRARLVLSLYHDENVERFYQAIREWLAINDDLSKFLVGIDFCGPELTPPDHYQRFLADVHEVNEIVPDLALGITYHVGESLDAGFLAASLSWIWQALQLGIHRLGHASCLGFDPVAIAGHPIEAGGDQIQVYRTWFDTNRDSLERHSNQPAGNDTNRLFRGQFYSEDDIRHLEFLRSAITTRIREKNIVVESCPTSTSRLFSKNPDMPHPLKIMGSLDLPMVIATDDPGIFRTSLANELNYCEQTLGIDTKKILNYSGYTNSAELDRLARRRHARSDLPQL